MDRVDSTGSPLSVCGGVVCAPRVRRGGGLVLGMGGNVTADRINGPLGALLPSPLRRPVAVAVVGEVGVPIALPDAQGSLFRAFQRGGRLEFGRGHVRQLYGLEPYEETDEVKTWMRLEGGLPLLVERRVGRGSVLLFASTFDLGWSDFPLQAAFMPWVQSLVQYLGGEAGGGQNRQTGLVSERVSVPLVDTALGITVRGPLGAVPAQVRNGAVHFVPTSSGAYVVETPGAPPLGWVAVNTDPAESDVRRTARLIESMADVDPEHFMLRTPLARWLLGLALLGSLLQGLLLVWLNRRRIRRSFGTDGSTTRR